ncbi:unnamed protein product [Discula destructiva]
MSPPDSTRREARRGASSGNGPTHIFQGGKDPLASSGSSSARQDVLAPPPRVQLTPSPNPEDQAARAARPRRASNAPSSRSISTSVVSMSTSTTSATSAVESLMQEKDARIAKLERELGQLSQNESETASFWQAKHSALNQHFLRLDTELQRLKGEVRAREAENDEVARGWREAMGNEMAARDDEIRELRAHVRGLKEWVSTSTRVDGTASTSDEVLGDSWARLGNGLQNWVITHFRKAKVDLSKVDEPTLSVLAELVPTYAELLDQGAKVHMLQSLVSRVLAQHVFGAYFVGLSAEQEEQMRRTEGLMATLGSVEAVNQWRSVTLSILKKEATGHLQSRTAQTVEYTVGKINRILDAITTDTSAQDRSTGHTTAQVKDQAIRQLIHNAVELSRLLVVQKAVFNIWMPEVLPHKQVLFDHATMEDLMGEDEESLVQREISCVTFPGIVKRGDENGSQLQFRNIVSKARVLCSSE